MKLTRRKKWYFIFGVFFCSILLFISTPVGALPVGFIRYYGYQVRRSWNGSCGTFQFGADEPYFYPSSDFGYTGQGGTGHFSACNVQNFIVETTEVQNMGGAYWSTSGQVNLVVDRGAWQGPPYAKPTGGYFNTDGIDVITASFIAGGTNVEVTGTDIETYDTLWSRTVNGTELFYETLTIFYSATGRGAGNGSGHFRILIGYPTDSGKGLIKSTSSGNKYWYFEQVNINPSLTFGTALDVVTLGQISGNLHTQITLDNMDRSDMTKSQNNSDSSSEGASGEATTIASFFIGNLVSFISTLYSVQSTQTCYIEPMTFRGYTITQRMDLCSLPVPSSLSAIGTLGCIFILLPFGVHVTRRMLALYEEVVH